MLKETIKYKDFDDEDVEEDLYFNLSEAELVELESKKQEGYGQWLQYLIKLDDNDQMFQEFKMLVLLSYGEKSPDGKHFLKKDANERPLSATFEQSAAYNALIYKMFTDEEFAAHFLKGIFPKRVIEQMAANEAGAPAPKVPPVPPKS